MTNGEALRTFERFLTWLNLLILAILIPMGIAISGVRTEIAVIKNSLSYDQAHAADLDKLLGDIAQSWSSGEVDIVVIKNDLDILRSKLGQCELFHRGQAAILRGDEREKE